MVGVDMLLTLHYLGIPPGERVANEQRTYQQDTMETPSEVSRTPLRLTLLALLPGLSLKLALHLSALTQYGYFRDELYYLASTFHLQAGYVEHPPLFIWLLAAWTSVFGDSLSSIRILSVLGGTALVAVVGLMVREMGGRYFAQGLSAVAAALTPVLLATEHFYSMNVFDQLLWAVAGFVLFPIFRRGEPRSWVLLGVVLGLGLLNKISVLFLGSGILLALLQSSKRSALLTKWPWIAAAIAFLISLPFLLWQAAHGFPLLEFMRNATRVKMVNPGPLAFLQAQALYMNPLAIPLFLSGLIGPLVMKSLRRYNYMTVIFLSVVVILLGSGSNKPYYLAPAYVFLLAPGAVVVERLCASRILRWTGWAYGALIVAGGLMVSPLSIPVLPVRTYIEYQRWTGISAKPEERAALGVLPQHFADMFGWEEFVAEVAKVYHALPPDERSKCAIFVRNYGEAGAIDILGGKFGLPRAICGHNTYWFWGPGSYDGKVLLMVGGDPQVEARSFESVERIGTTPDSEYSMPYERKIPIFLCKGLKIPLAEAWARAKMLI